MTLLATLREHSDVLEADVQRYYGIDLADLWRGTLSLRRVRVLVNGLPSGSLAARRVAGVDLDDPLLTLSYADVLLARVADEVAALRWEWEAAHADPKRKHLLRKAPTLVMPSLRPAKRQDDNVIPLVSPHELGEFMARRPGEE